MSLEKKRPLWQSVPDPTPQAFIPGTSGPDVLVGTPSDDDIRGFEGNDSLTGLGGNDFLVGGTGDDAMDGGPGNDTYFVDSQGDTVAEVSNGGNDTIYTDVTYMLASNAEIEILAAFDQAGTQALNLYGNGTANWIWGTNGVNFLSGGGGNDILDAFGGDDPLNGGDGNDYLAGGEGNDALVGGLGNDTLVGGNGNDSLDGRITTFDQFTDNDTLIGGLGDDIYFVNHNGDVVIESAGGGFDIVYTTGTFSLGAGQEVEVVQALDSSPNQLVALDGNELDNRLYGNAANGVLRGFGGNDVLNGLGGDDFLDAGDGNDYLDSGTGSGRLFGGAGADTFAFSTFSPGFDVRIEDFVSGTDKIVFYSNVFTALSAGPLPASAFVQGSNFGPGSFHDTDDRFFYDIANGQLIYDPDGSGSAPASWSVFLQPSTPGAPLAASDIIVF